MQVQQDDDIDTLSPSSFGNECSTVFLDITKLYGKYSGKVDGGSLMAAYLFFGIRIAMEWDKGLKVKYRALPGFVRIATRIIMWLHMIYEKSLKEKTNDN